MILDSDYLIYSYHIGIVSDRFSDDAVFVNSKFAEIVEATKWIPKISRACFLNEYKCQRKFLTSNSNYNAYD